MKNAPITSWLRSKGQEAGYRSFDKLAQEVLDKWRRLEPRLPKCTARALGNKIGGLDRAEPRPEILAWWRRRAAAEQALAEALNVPIEDLPTQVGGASAARLFPLAEYDEFRPFDPLREQPLILGEPDLMARVTRGDWVIDREWIVVPPAAGKSLAVHWFRTHGVYAREVRTLAAAHPLLATADPLVIAVDAPDPLTDASMASHLASRGPVRVLAPFPPPSIQREGASLSEGERQLLKLRPPQWKVTRWQPVRGWRRTFLAWLAKRTTRGALDADALHDWLDRNDPTGVEFAAPGDVLPLAAFAASLSSGDFPALVDLADRFVEERTEDAASTWLRDHAAEALQALAGALLAQIDLPWRGPLSRERWAGLVPPHLAEPRLDDQALDKVLEAVAKPRGADKRREAKERAREQLARPDALSVVRELESVRLLRSVTAGGLVLHPAWLANALARRQISAAFAGEPGTTWGRWAVDATRRPLVDAAVDALDEASLLRLIRRTVERHDPASLGCVGAVETLFAAVGRRLDPGRRLSSPWLGRLAQLQIDLITFDDFDRPSPTTRPGFDASDRRVEWLADCWGWSLWTPAPEHPVPEGIAWLFPGWARVALAELPPWGLYGLDDPPLVDETGLPDRQGLRSFPRELVRALAKRARSAPPSGPPTAHDRLMGIAPLVLERCSDPDLPSSPLKINGYLLSAAILAAPRWKLPFELVQFVLGSHWGAYLAGRLAAAPPDGQQAIADALWRSLAEHAGLVATLDQLWLSPDLYDVVVEIMSDAAIGEALDRHGLPAAELFSRFRDLPPRLRLPVVRWLTGHEGDDAAWLIFAAEQAGLEDVEWVDWLLDRYPNAAVGQRPLWRFAPARALERALATAPDHAGQWFDTAPPDSLPSLLQQVEGWAKRPPWAERWLRKRVLDGGSLADRAYALLRSPSSAS